MTVSYLGADGVRRELREPWLVAPNAAAMADADGRHHGRGLDGPRPGRRRDRPGQEAALRAAGGRADPRRPAPVDAAAEPAAVGRRGAVDHAAGLPGPQRRHRLGHLRPPADLHLQRARTRSPSWTSSSGWSELLPQNGLILDVRGNGGGHIFASEFTLQTLTPRRITPEPVQFISTPLNLRDLPPAQGQPDRPIDLGPWFPSLDQAVETGSIYSAAFPITPEDGANAIGQRYHGPVVLVTDARCYSATDIFAAGFQDHEIGPVLGVDDNTGAGGANVWTHGLLKPLLRRSRHRTRRSPYAPLPKQAEHAGGDPPHASASARWPARRSRTSASRPDARHELTRRDVLEGNVDLLDAAGRAAGRRCRSAGSAHAVARRGGTLTVAAHHRRDRPGRRATSTAGRGQQRRDRRGRDADLRRGGRGRRRCRCRASPPESWWRPGPSISDGRRAILRSCWVRAAGRRPSPRPRRRRRPGSPPPTSPSGSPRADERTSAAHQPHGRRDRPGQRLHPVFNAHPRRRSGVIVLFVAPLQDASSASSSSPTPASASSRSCGPSGPSTASPSSTRPAARGPRDGRRAGSCPSRTSCSTT